MRVRDLLWTASLTMLMPVPGEAAEWRYVGGGEQAVAVNEPGPVASQARPVGGTQELDAPRNNMSQAVVRQRYGDPEQEIAPVGRPPISRWRYPDYIVYFEGDRVIISVPAEVGVSR